MTPSPDIPTAATVRDRFPALGRTVDGKPAVYFDGPAGSQVPTEVIEAIGRPLRVGISNLGGAFAASAESERIVSDARRAAADLLAVPQGGTVAFGQSMTALNLMVAEALRNRLGPGDEIVLTRLDHDANISPWLFVAEATGASIRWIDFDPGDGCRLVAPQEAITAKTRVLAVTHASNALGVIPDVAGLCRAARERGAITVVDAVHFAAHGAVDMARLDCDFLLCSAYKFHGPHVGLLALGPRVLEDVRPVRIRPAPTDAPGSWERGTPSFELQAGVTAAIDYLASLGSGEDRRARLVSGLDWAHRQTGRLVNRFMAGIEPMHHVRLFGPGPDEPRTPTMAIEIMGVKPQSAAEELGRAGIFTWPGHNYALEVMRRLDRLESGGLLRVGFMHYNTEDELDRTLDVIGSLR